MTLHRSTSSDENTARQDNPYIALECIHEHMGSCWSALRREGREVGVAGERPRFKLGTPEYHLHAANEAADRLFQALAKILPPEEFYA